MRKMQVDDRGFAQLMARWIIQSEPRFGNSGGSAKCDTDSSGKEAPLASFRPFESRSWFSSFTKVWTKQDHFKRAEPNLSVVFTAMSHKYGRDWMVYGNSAINWYRFGISDFEKMAPIYLKTMEVLKGKNKDKHIVLYGRDCLPFFRIMRYWIEGHKISYVEGVSRNVCSGLMSSFDYDSGSDKDNKVRLKEYLIKNIGGNIDPDKLLHVDTGFGGSIPKACIAALRDKFDDKRDAGAIWMMSSNHKPWDMGFSRGLITKLEARPKFFFRPSKWIKNPQVYTEPTIVDEVFGPPKMKEPVANTYASTITAASTASSMGTITFKCNVDDSSTAMTSWHTDSNSNEDVWGHTKKLYSWHKTYPTHKCDPPPKPKDNFKKHYEQPKPNLEYEAEFVPELKITGDAINAAAYNIGFMAAAAAKGLKT